MDNIVKRAKQARSLKTEQELLDAFERLLTKKPFFELTVSELAMEAGLTTGAIYRRFNDKNDVLRSAFQRFYARAESFFLTSDAAYPSDMTDRMVLETFLKNMMLRTLENIHLMRAANSLNDPQSFKLMIKARDIAADWLANRLCSSDDALSELQMKCRFVLRVATAVFRDTFLSGRAAVSSHQDYLDTHQTELSRLNAELVDMAHKYLCLAEGGK